MSDLRLLNPAEVPTWDIMLDRTAGATFFHSSAWARVLQTTYGYKATYLAKFGSDRFDSLLPLMEVDSWLTGKRGVSLPFTDAVEALGADSNSTANLFSDALLIARERGWKYLECRGARSSQPDAVASTSFLNHVVDLTNDESALFNRLEEPVRRAVRRGDQQGLLVEFSQDLKSVHEFYSLLCRTRRRHGVPPQPFLFFDRICEHVLGRGHGWVVLARKGTIPVAGAVFFHFAKHAVYKFGASNEEFQQLRGNNAVMWHAIRRYAKRGFTTLDLGRTSLSNEGLRRFKLGWGARERQVSYMRYDFERNSFVTARDDSTGWHNRVFRALPKPLSKIAGALLYRHIA